MLLPLIQAFMLGLSPSFGFKARGNLAVLLPELSRTGSCFVNFKLGSAHCRAIFARPDPEEDQKQNALELEESSPQICTGS